MMRFLARFLGQLRLDIVIQWRNGFYLVSALILVPTVFVLRFLDDAALAWALPLILFQNTIINTFFFVAGQVLLEQAEGTLGAQAATPLRHAEYLGAKIVTLTALSTSEGVLIAVLAYGDAIDLLALVWGLVSLGVVLVLAGLIVISRYDSINTFLMPAVAWQLVACLPILRALGLLDSPLLFGHPLEPSLRALEAAFGVAATAPTYWLLAPIAWLVPFVLLGLGRFRVRPQELTS